MPKDSRRAEGTSFPLPETRSCYFCDIIGTGSGQEVPHFHLHVVPRRAGSDWGYGPPHIARLQRPARPAHLDHTVVTDEKRATVDTLRRGFKA